MRALLFAALLMAPLARGAEPVPADKNQKIYDGLMSDTDLYVGEGVVSLSSYGGDLVRAKASGRERARGSMAENIKVRVQSQVTDTQKGGSTGSSEEIEAKSSSSSDLELQDVQYKYLEGFPKEGQLTVLAFLSKEEYRRQLAGQIYVKLAPGNGFGIHGGMFMADFLASEFSRSGHGFGGGFTASVGAQFFMEGWMLGVGDTHADIKTKFYHPQTPAAPLYERPFGIDLVLVQAGYDYTPWKKKVQPYFPLRADLGLLMTQGGSTLEYLGGLSAGAGLRWWMNHFAALHVSGIYHAGLNSVPLRDPTFGELYSAADQPIKASLSGSEFQVGLIFSGF